MKEWFWMQGYGFYVWSSYGIAVALLLFYVCRTFIQYKKALK